MNHRKVLVDVRQSLLYAIEMIENVKASKALAANIKALRESEGLSPAELGEAIGVSKQAIWNIEHEESWVSKDMLGKLSKHFKVEETDLFKPNGFETVTKLLKK